MGLEQGGGGLVVKLGRCHVLLPAWPTNSISSGGPEGLLTFETADGAFSSSFPGGDAAGLAISSSWLEVDKPLMVTIEWLLSTITSLPSDPARKIEATGCFCVWTFKLMSFQNYQNQV